MIYKIIRKFLFILEPELAHNLVFKFLKILNFIGILDFFRPNYREGNKKVFNTTFKNLIGVAAGLDKNAEYINIFDKLGFGFIEVGTLTPRPQPGNRKPRIFRLINEKAIINRFGFNNVGIDQALINIKKSKYQGVLGINIGKNFDTPTEEAIEDYLICFRKAYKYASYITINISSPNTKNLRELQNKDYFVVLVSQIKNEQSKLTKLHSKYVPFVVKISPDCSNEEIDNICEVLLANNVDGVIATNTTISRDGLNSKFKNEEGGLSGAPLKNKSLDTQKRLYAKLRNKITIIGVGGIMTAADAKEKFDNGADLIQIYSGFIYRGNTLIHELLKSTSQK
jgi:dihydroorotate dehydrogenase